MEWKLFDGDVPHVSTAEFHADRPRAPHLEQPAHRPRLLRAAALVSAAAKMHRMRSGMESKPSVSDLGCGDGGLLSLVRGEVDGWGYDFSPANAQGWVERGVTAAELDVFGEDRERVQLGDITVVTEVLEHIADPHDAVAWIAKRSRFVVASSPWNERPEWHDECHAWAWDQAGYRALVESGGFRIIQHQTVDQFQLILGWRP